jgi:phosphoribosylformylglycinamidine (FGAM) synthase-like amidotransferase family enzyme
MSRSDELNDQVQEGEPLPPSSTVTFLHAVGQSTIRQGMTVPVIAQIAWLSEIQKGDAIPVTITFGEGESVSATLRRINNERGHLQFRYESRTQTALRDYLTEVFGSTEQANGVL